MSDPDLTRLSKFLGTNPRAQDKESASAPVQQFCGDIDMRIARDGTWFYIGSPIGRKPMVKLFASVLHRDDVGDYWLETPFEKCRIQVDDAPFVAVEMTVRGEGADRAIDFRTNIDEWVASDAAHPIRVATEVETGEPAPYVLIRDGLEALIARSVFYDLVELGEVQTGPDGESLGIWSRGAYFNLGTVEDE